MKMTEANQLSRIYNTLLLVRTSGEDTITMGKCLDAFKTFLTQVDIEEKNNELSEEE